MKPGRRSFGVCSVRVSLFTGHYIAPSDAARVRVLSHVETEEAHRGRGHATRMMRRLFVDADGEGLALVLEPKAYDDEPMDRNALESWYTRLGFQRIQVEPCLMVRLPRQ